MHPKLLAVLVACLLIAGCSGSPEPDASSTFVYPTHTVPVLVQNTDQDGVKIGVRFYRNTATPEPLLVDNQAVAATEGAQLELVCQIRDGRKAVDVPYGNRQTSSTVWDEVLVPGKPAVGFVSDIYLSTPKVSGSKPPAGISLCSQSAK